MFFNKNVFISHSSANKEIAEHLSAYLIRVGVKEQNIFCSSIIGQGVANGEKLNVAIGKAIKKSKLIIFLLSHDFIKSSYCMEELGVGWYLAQQHKAMCFYLVLPDIALSELNGFVNSKIDKFSFVDPEQKEGMEFFILEVAKHVHLRRPEHQVIVNASRTFFRAIQHHLYHLIEKLEESRELEERNNKKIEELNLIIATQKEIIEKQKQNREKDYKRHEKEKQQAKYITITHLFQLLTLPCGLRKKQFDSLSEGFWFKMLNEYIELEKELDCEDDGMQLLLANIYSHKGYLDKAYQRLLKYIELTDSSVYPLYFENITLGEDNNADEAINLLKRKLENQPLGIVYDSYKETIEFLEKRKKDLTNR